MTLLICNLVMKLERIHAIRIKYAVLLTLLITLAKQTHAMFSYSSLINPNAEHYVHEWPNAL